MEVQILSPAPPVTCFLTKKECVMSQKKSDKEIGQELLKQYQTLGCTGIIRLIQYLLSPEGKDLVSLGSSSLGLSELLERSDLSKAEKLALADDYTYKLHLGSVRDAETPLQTLLRYTEELERAEAILLPKDNGGTQAISLERFDAIWGELISMLLQEKKSPSEEPPKSTPH